MRLVVITIALGKSLPPGSSANHPRPRSTTGNCALAGQRLRYLVERPDYMLELAPEHPAGARGSPAFHPERIPSSSAGSTRAPKRAGKRMRAGWHSINWVSSHFSRVPPPPSPPPPPCPCLSSTPLPLPPPTSPLASPPPPIHGRLGTPVRRTPACRALARGAQWVLDDSTSSKRGSK